MITVAQWAAQLAAAAPPLNANQKARLSELLTPQAKDASRTRQQSRRPAA